MTTGTGTHVQTGDDSAIRGTLDAIYAAWADNDADAFVVPYADDATAILPGSYLENKAAIRATMAAVLAGPLKGSRATYDVRSVRFPGPGTAIVISQGAVIYAGQTEPAAKTQSRETWVLAKQDGNWLVEAFHNCPLNAA
jgi:uncharacterized protein (TIGR02246 family)